MFLNTATHRLTKCFEIMGVGSAGIDQEVAVFFGYLCAADDHATAPGGIDFLPGLAAGRVGKCAATGTHAARLRNHGW